jgi:hypothetical protein
MNDKALDNFIIESQAYGLTGILAKGMIAARTIIDHSMAEKNHISRRRGNVQGI